MLLPRDPLKSSKIIPDVIDGVAKESIELTVDYGRGHVAKGGVSITPAAVSKACAFLQSVHPAEAELAHWPE